MKPKIYTQLAVDSNTSEIWSEEAKIVLDDKQWLDIYAINMVYIISGRLNKDDAKTLIACMKCADANKTFDITSDIFVKTFSTIGSYSDYQIKQFVAKLYLNDIIYKVDENIFKLNSLIPIWGKMLWSKTLSIETYNGRQEEGN